MLSRHTIEHELTIVSLIGVAYIRPASERNCRGSDDRYDTRLLVGGDFLLGDHGGHRDIVLSQLRDHRVSKLSIRASRNYVGIQCRGAEQCRFKERHVYQAYRRAVTGRGSSVSDTSTTHGEHPGGVGTATASDRR
jgi:hypothetical protein